MPLAEATGDSQAEAAKSLCQKERQPHSWGQKATASYGH
jgi:hypothetical protein